MSDCPTLESVLTVILSSTSQPCLDYRATLKRSQSYRTVSMTVLHDMTDSQHNRMPKMPDISMKVLPGLHIVAPVQARDALRLARL